MKNILVLFLAIGLTSPALARETEDALASRVKFPVPEGLCAMPANDLGNAIFERLDRVQQDIGNRMIAVFPTCEDAKQIEDGKHPSFSHYAAIATSARAVEGPLTVDRAQLLSETAKQLQSGQAAEAGQQLLENAQETLKEMGIRDIEQSQPVSYVGQDEMAVYALMRQRVSNADKTSTEVMGILSATSLNGLPVFAYFYDTPPEKESSVRLYEANKSYLAQLEEHNRAP